MIKRNKRYDSTGVRAFKGQLHKQPPDPQGQRYNRYIPSRKSYIISDSGEVYRIRTTLIPIDIGDIIYNPYTGVREQVVGIDADGYPWVRLVYGL